MLDVRRLRVLKEVADRGSFSAAAAALSFSQPAISQQVAALEREAGTTLVERGPRGVRLTEAGRVLVGHAEAVLARLAQAESELEALAGLDAGRLRLMSFTSAGATLMPPAIARIRERHPGLEISLEPGERDVAPARVRNGDVDVALILTGRWEDRIGEGIEATHVLDDPMHVVLPAGHPKAAKPNLKLSDLADEQWIRGVSTTDCPDSELLDRACAAAGFEPNTAFDSDDYIAIQGFVAAGVGLALIPELALASARDDIVVRSLGPDAPVRVIQAIIAGHRSPAKLAAIDVLVEIGAEFAAGDVAQALAS